MPFRPVDGTNIYCTCIRNNNCLVSEHVVSSLCVFVCVRCKECKITGVSDCVINLCHIMVLFPFMLCSKAYVYKPYLDPLQLGWDRGPQLSNCAENFCQIILDQCLDFFSSQEMSTRVYFRFSGAFAFPRLVSSWLGKSPAPFKFGM